MQITERINARYTPVACAIEEWRLQRPSAVAAAGTVRLLPPAAAPAVSSLLQPVSVETRSDS